MKSNTKILKQYIIIDLFILTLSAAGIYNFSQKADLPFKVHKRNSTFVAISQIMLPQVNAGDTITSIDNIPFKSREEVEVYIDSKKIGDLVNIEVSKRGVIHSVKVELINFYSTSYVIIATIVGFIFFITGIIVLFKAKFSNIARVFHWSMISTAMIILLTWGNYTDSGIILGFLTRVGFHLGYTFVPSFFLHFSLLFPSELNINYRKYLKFIYGISLVFTLILSIVFAFLINEQSIYYIQLYLKTFDFVSIFVVALIIFSLGIQFKKYFSTQLLSARRKLRWIFFGYLIGPVMYLILWVIPQRLTDYGLIPEEIIVLLNVFVPIAFAIAIIRYHIFDIDVIIKRSIVYPISIVFVIMIYAAIFFVIIHLIELPNTYIASIITAIVVAMFFYPIKEEVKKIVNKKIFKVEYDYRIALNDFLNEIKETNDLNILTKKILHFINRIIPCEKIAFLIYNQAQNSLFVYQHLNFNKIENSKIEFQQNLYGDKLFLVSEKGSVEENTGANFELPIILNEEGIKLNYFIKSEANQTYGVLVIGEKKCGALFSIEDIDLLNIIVIKFAETIEKLKLQEELIREKIEKEKYEELNKLKSFFVSSVSHDLKTPLTSIKMFAEILKSSKNIPAEKASKYLDIIEGESDRLTRLIDNVLNYSKLERGIKEYNFQPINFNILLEEILKMMEYQFKMNKFSVTKTFEGKDLIANADRDCVIEAIINLISNSMKFSPDEKEIEIKLYSENSFIAVEVIDKGIGVNESEINNLFLPFFQSSKTNIDQKTGAGLGLTIVKHIIDAHKGKIIVKRAEVKGSSFKLLFPKME